MLITTYLCSCFIPFMRDAVVFIMLLSNDSGPGVVLLKSPGNYMWCCRVRWQEIPVGGRVFVARTLTLLCFVLRADHSLVRRSVGWNGPVSVSSVVMWCWRHHLGPERGPVVSAGPCSCSSSGRIARAGRVGPGTGGTPFHVGMSSNILLVIKAIRTWHSSVPPRCGWFLPAAFRSSRRRNVFAGRQYFAGWGYLPSDQTSFLLAFGCRWIIQPSLIPCHSPRIRTKNSGF